MNGDSCTKCKMFLTRAESSQTRAGSTRLEPARVFFDSSRVKSNSSLTRLDSSRLESFMTRAESSQTRVEPSRLELARDSGRAESSRVRLDSTRAGSRLESDSTRLGLGSSLNKAAKTSRARALLCVTTSFLICFVPFERLKLVLTSKTQQSTHSPPPFTDLYALRFFFVIALALAEKAGLPEKH